MRPFLLFAVLGSLTACGGDVFYLSTLSEPDVEPVLAPEAEPDPTAEPDAEPDAQPEPTPDAEPEPTPDAEPEPTPDAEPEPTPDAEPEPTPDAEPEPSPDVPVPDCYSEPIFPDEDIGDLVGTYGGANWKDELIEAMDRRHPATAYLLDEMRNDSYFGQFSDSSSWSGMVGWLDTLSHEETHLFNAYHAIDVGEYAAIYMREDLIYYMPSTSTPQRSLVLSQLAPELANGIYAPTYLTGWQGERGFNELLDETSAYLNEIGAVGSVGEYFPGYGVSLRDGAPALLHFVQIYLRELRAHQPAAWDAIQQVEVYREIVLTLWLRLHFLLEYADAFDTLGINDGMYRDALHDEDLMEEISLFTGRVVGPDACLYD